MTDVALPVDTITCSIFGDRKEPPRVDPSTRHVGRAHSNAEPERELSALQRALATFSTFFVREASWRRSRGHGFASRPEPPWSGGVAILDRLLRRGIFCRSRAGSRREKGRQR